MPSIGKLRYSVDLQEATRTTDAGGGSAVAWGHLTRIYADIRPVSGRENYRQDQVQETVSHEVTIRHRAGVSIKHRLVYGTRVFNIKHVRNIDERDRFLLLLCDEGVAA